MWFNKFFKHKNLQVWIHAWYTTMCYNWQNNGKGWISCESFKHGNEKRVKRGKLIYGGKVYKANITWCINYRNDLLSFNLKLKAGASIFNNIKYLTKITQFQDFTSHTHTSLRQFLQGFKEGIRNIKIISEFLYIKRGKIKEAISVFHTSNSCKYWLYRPI